jgi:formamidopyrimidine-DNA glycosylase
MPELPEVESVRKGLVRARVRAPIVAVWRSPYGLRTGAYWARAKEGVGRLRGATPGRIKRRGKYLIWHMRASGGDPLGLIVHLGMSGRCGIARIPDQRAAHTHLVLRFGDDRELRFVDPRRFGGVRVGPLDELYYSGPIAALGPEPLGRGFGGRHLEASLGNSERVLRDALLDQRVVAGIGNIYAVEALFDARLHPLLPCRRLSSSAWERLAASLQGVLRSAIQNGGTTLKDFRNVTGEVGRNQDDLRVYGRGGQPCPACGEPLRPFVHGGRSGVFCGRDQARPRTRRVP